MKIKVSEANCYQLNWLVAQCQGVKILAFADSHNWAQGDYVLYAKSIENVDGEYSPTTDWAQGGPIIEREKITLSDCEGGWASGLNGTLTYFSKTPLIAAMRCYVASKLGDEVEVPEGLA